MDVITYPRSNPGADLAVSKRYPYFPLDAKQLSDKYWFFITKTSLNDIQWKV